ncbi:UNVERIFIED_ORG: hypothetical protein MaF1725_ph0026 [Mycobacterium phage ADLER F1725]
MGAFVCHGGICPAGPPTDGGPNEPEPAPPDGSAAPGIGPAFGPTVPCVCGPLIIGGPPAVGACSVLDGPPRGALCCPSCPPVKFCGAAGIGGVGAKGPATPESITDGANGSGADGGSGARRRPPSRDGSVGADGPAGTSWCVLPFGGGTARRHPPLSPGGFVAGFPFGGAVAPTAGITVVVSTGLRGGPSGPDFVVSAGGAAGGAGCSIDESGPWAGSGGVTGFSGCREGRWTSSEKCRPPCERFSVTLTRLRPYWAIHNRPFVRNNRTSRRCFQN